MKDLFHGLLKLIAAFLLFVFLFYALMCMEKYLMTY
jgi:hypothetical protein